MPTILATTALHEEASVLIRRGRFRKVENREGASAYLLERDTGLSVALLITGVGANVATRAISSAVEKYRPEAIVASGFAGGCRNDALTGSIVVASEVRKLEGAPYLWGPGTLAKPLVPDRELISLARSAAEAGDLDFVIGRMISLPSIAKTPGLKRWLGDRLEAVAADMESYAAGEVAAASDLPFVCARGIVDEVNEELPSLVEAFSDASDSTLGRFRTLLGAVLQQPRGIVDLPALLQSTVTARRSIATFVMAFVEAWFAADVRRHSAAAD